MRNIGKSVENFCKEENKLKIVWIVRMMKIVSFKGMKSIGLESHVWITVLWSCLASELAAYA